MLTRLLILTQRRFDRAQQKQIKLQSLINTLEKKQTDVQSHIEILKVQSTLYEKSAEFSKIIFWEQQRAKALLLNKIAYDKYQLDEIADELARHQQALKCIEAQLFSLSNKCEKFRNYLKQQSKDRCLKLECQQQNEIEELAIYDRCKNGDE